MAKPMRLVGLTGSPGSGKDTVANLLVTHCGYKKLAFADPLYAEISEAFGVEMIALKHRPHKEIEFPFLSLSMCTSRDYVNAVLACLSQKAQEKGLDFDHRRELHKPRSPRWTLRMWGDEYRRQNHGDGYWISQMIGRIQFLKKEVEQDRFVISDVRYHNEKELVRRYGGALWNITRNTAPLRVGEHGSEVDPVEFDPDVVINNSFPIKHLFNVVLARHVELDCGLRNVVVAVGDQTPEAIGYGRD